MEIELIEETGIAEYSRTEAALSGLRIRYGAVKFQTEIPAGMQLAISARAEIRGYRVDLEKKRKEIKAPALEHCKLIDAEAARITLALESLEKPIDAQIKSEETRKELEKAAKIAAERARVDAIKLDIQSIRDVAMSVIGKSIEEIATALEFLDDFNCTEERFAEFGPDASRTVGETMDTITTIYHKAIAAKAEAEIIQLEREAEAARLAAEHIENERLRAELDAQRIEQSRIAAEAAKQAAATLKLERDTQAAELAKERAEADRIRKLEDDKRAFDEQQRREAAEAENARMQIERAKIAEAQAKLDQQTADAEAMAKMIELAKLQLEADAATEELAKSEALKAVEVQNGLAELADSVNETHAERTDRLIATADAALKDWRGGKLIATWDLTLNTECPHCKDDVDLLAYGDFWDGRKLDAFEHGTNRSRNVEVHCPDCDGEFIVDLEY